MRLLAASLIIAMLTVFALFGCGKKGPPTLKDIKAGVHHERTH